MLGWVGVHPARWAASAHTGLCHPRNVFDQEFMPKGTSPGLLIRSHSPGGLPPSALSHTEAQQTIARGRWAGSSGRAWGPHPGGTVSATHREYGNENSPALHGAAGGLKPIKAGTTH